MIASSQSQIILTSVILMLVYWVSYFGSRRKLFDLGRGAEVVFALNMIMGVVLIGGYQLYVLKSFGLFNPWLVITTFFIVASILAHHLAVFAIDYKSKRKAVFRLHGAISHLVFSVSFGINAVAVGAKFLGLVVSPADTLIFITFVALALGSVLGTFLVGVGKLKLPYQ